MLNNRIKVYIHTWINVKHDPEEEPSGFAKISALFWIILCYTPFIMVVAMIVSIIIEEQNISWDQMLRWAVLTSPILMISMAFHRSLEYPIYARWGKIAAIISLPLVLILKPIFFTLELVLQTFVTTLEVLFEGLKPLFALAILAFVVLGIIGLLLFGIRQIF